MYLFIIDRYLSHKSGLKHLFQVLVRDDLVSVSKLVHSSKHWNNSWFNTLTGGWNMFFFYQIHNFMDLIGVFGHFSINSSEWKTWNCYNNSLLL